MLQRHVFPKLAGIEYLHYDQNQRLFEALTLLDFPEGQTRRIKVLKEIAKRLKTFKKPAMLSSEHFVMPGNWLATPVAKPTMRLDSPQILSSLEKLGDDVRILLVIRRQVDWLESWYQERIKRYETRKFHSVLNAPEFKPIVELLQFDRVFLDLAQRFGKKNIFVVPFELLKSDPEDFLRRISEACGQPAQSLPLPIVRGRINPRVLIARRNSNKFLLKVAKITGGQTSVDHRLFKVFKKIYAYDFLLGRRHSGNYDFGALPDEQTALYSKSNKNLAAITGLDLKKLGYC